MKFSEVNSFNIIASDDFYSRLLYKAKVIRNIDNPLVTSVMALQAEAIFSQRVETFQEPETKILNICNEAIKLFPNSEGAKECKSIRSEILRKELTLSMQNVALPNHSISAKITYRNLTNPHYRIYKVNDDELENLRNKNNQETIKELLKKNPKLKAELEEVARLKNPNNVQPSLEKQESCIVSTGVYTYETIKDITIRKMVILLRTIDARLHYFAYRQGELSGMVKFKNEISHWIYGVDNKNKFDDIMTMDSLRDKLKDVT